MTCIVGLVDNGDVWIGGDSAGIAGWASSERADTKVFRRGPFLFGFTSSFRMGQLLRYRLEVPEMIDGEQSIDEYLTVSFVDAVRDVLKTGGMAKKKEDVEEGGTFLLGFRGRLFTVADDYQVGENTKPYDACGAGHELALGAMYASEHLDPEDRIRQALAAADEWSASVRPPFHILTLVGPNR